MNRLDYVLPEHTRVIWTSEDTKRVWETKIQAVSNYILDMELESVLDRRVALRSVRPDDLPGLLSWARARDLIVLPLEAQGEPSLYASSSIPYFPGLPYTIRVAVLPVHLVPAFQNAWNRQDDDGVGALLGYPKCCRDFFKRVWVDEKYLDTTWPMATSAGVHPETDAILLKPNMPECNILLRWLGVRAVPYLPCSFECEMTLLFAMDFLKKDRPEYDLLYEMLLWPVQWTALHGIAEIKTPVCKISTRTDATPTKYTVEWMGKLAGQKISYGKELVQTMNSKTWEENGFASKEAMNKAHSVVMSVTNTDNHGIKSVHDLGCGNGFLLNKFKNVQRVGLDSDPEKEKGFRVHCPDGFFFAYDVSMPFIPIKHPSLALISSNRFEDTQDRVRLFMTLSLYDFLVVYTYESKVYKLNDLWEVVCSVTEGPNAATMYRRRRG